MARVRTATRSLEAAAGRSFASWLLGLGAARAEPSAPQSDADRAIEEARGAQSQGHLEEAIAGYERAYESSGDPALLFTLGELLRQVNRDAAAVKMFRAYLRHDPRGKHQRSAEKQIDELSAPAAHAPATPAPAPASAPVQPLRGRGAGTLPHQRRRPALFQVPRSTAPAGAAASHDRRSSRCRRTQLSRNRPCRPGCHGR